MSARKTQATLALLLTITAISWATDVRGPISTDTTWTEANSPYVMIGSIIVHEGATLTIASGVTVEVGDEFAITIQGCLVAVGTATKPIVFTAETGNEPGKWGNIRFEDTSTDAEFDANGNYVNGSILQHCIVEYAGSSGEGAVWCENASPYINWCDIRHNAKSGIYANHSAPMFISNCTISNNTASAGGGIYANSSTVTISNCTISNNTAGNGGGISAKSSTVTVSDCTISGNTSRGSYYVTKLP